jgi:hypothetical protein
MIFYWERDLLGQTRTWLLSRCVVQPPVAPEHVRTTFNTTPLPNFIVQKNHTHAKSAADRSGGSGFLSLVCRRLGLEPYFYQMSRSDQRKGRVGARTWLWNKDLTAAPSNFNPLEGQPVVMVDVDYYIDMPYFLTTQFRPVLLYTLQPSAVAATRLDYSYTFNENNVLDYKVSGGGSYSHKIWNWQLDNLNVMAFPYGVPTFVSYLVDRRATNEDHDLVLLSPLARWTGFSAIVAWFTIGGSRLERYSPNRGEFNVLNVRGQETHTYSIGVPGQFSSANMTEEEYSALANTAELLKTPISMPTTEAQLANSYAAMDKTAIKLSASVTTRYLRSLTKHKPMTVFPVEQGVRSYQYNIYDQDAPASLTPFMSPLMHGAFAPALTQGNEDRAIDSRIVAVRPAEDGGEISPFMDRVMDEFLERLIPVPHLLHPTDQDELALRQCSPSQRNILDSAVGMTLKAAAYVSSFVKKEAYPTPNDPRVISTIGARLKRDYSLFYYSYADQVLKPQTWYAFGKTPLQIATAITTLLGSARSAAMTDFSRFDGHKDKISRELERRAFTRAFNVSYHNEILELHNSTFNLSGSGRFGTKYDTGTAQNSGVPDTGGGNTQLNAFVNFLAHRKTRVNGHYMDADAAWSALDNSIFGGDDGLITDPCETALVAAAALLNHVMTIDVIPRGEFGVTFLARIYGPSVWYGCPNSTCDIARQLSKFHTTPNLPSGVTAQAKLVEKARSFFLTDSETPIIGQLVCRVLELSHDDALRPLSDDVRKSIGRWGDEVPKAEQYPNELQPWMTDYMLVCLPGIAEGVFDRWLENSRTLDDLLRAPLIVEPARVLPKAEAVVDEETFSDPEVPKAVDYRAKRKTTKPKQHPGVRAVKATPVRKDEAEV